MPIKKNSLKYAEILLLILVWIVLIAAPIFFRDEEITGFSDILGPLETLIPLLIIFLVNRFLLVPYLFFEKKSWIYLTSVVGLIAIFTLGSYLISDKPENLKHPHEVMGSRQIPPPHHQPPGYRLPQPMQPERHRPIPAFANLLIFSVLLVGFDTGLKTSFRLADTERARAKLEKENVGTQLAFLRNQVSPHFFMNTLNNIHAQISYNADEAKDSIIRLSKLMRHLLYDSEADKIPIQKEIDFIKNYVDLMKLRYSDKVKINLSYPDQLPDKSIPPLLFTSYVENAFKHGISYHNSSYIDIAFTCTSDKLTIKIKNSKPQQDKKEESSGIGIENSRKRLDLIYGDNYELKIEEEEYEHYVLLIIPI